MKCFSVLGTRIFSGIRLAEHYTTGRLGICAVNNEILPLSPEWEATAKKVIETDGPQLVTNADIKMRRRWEGKVEFEEWGDLLPVKESEDKDPRALVMIRPPRGMLQKDQTVSYTGMAFEEYAKSGVVLRVYKEVKESVGLEVCFKSGVNLVCLLDPGAAFRLQLPMEFNPDEFIFTWEGEARGLRMRSAGWVNQVEDLRRTG